MGWKLSVRNLRVFLENDAHTVRIVLVATTEQLGVLNVPRPAPCHATRARAKLLSVWWLTYFLILVNQFHRFQREQLLMADQTGESASSGAKQRSPVEKCLVWGGIALLLVVVLIEYRAKSGFDSAVAWLDEHENKKPTVDEIDAALAGASQTAATDDAVTYAFFSLFKAKDYEIVCDLGKQGDALVMESYYTTAGMEATRAEVEQQAKERMEAIPVSEESPGMPDGVEGGGGGGPGGMGGPGMGGGDSHAPSGHGAPPQGDGADEGRQRPAMDDAEDDAPAADEKPADEKPAEETSADE